MKSSLFIDSYLWIGREIALMLAESVKNAFATYLKYELQKQIKNLK